MFGFVSAGAVLATVLVLAQGHQMMQGPGQQLRALFPQYDPSTQCAVDAGCRRRRDASREASVDLPMKGQGLVQITIDEDQTESISSYKILLSNESSDMYSIEVRTTPVHDVRLLDSVGAVVEEENLNNLQHAHILNDLVHFDQSSIDVWVSVDKKNGYLRFGYGYPLIENTIIVSGPIDICLGEEFADCPLNNITIVSSDIGDLQYQTSKFPIVKHQPHLLIDRHDNTMEDIEENTAVVPATLPWELFQLYNLVGGEDITLSEDDGKKIDTCVKTPGCILYELIKNKTGEFGDDEASKNMVYIRATIGPDLGNSPGSPYVMEIWPPHSYSPIHDHADSVAVIKVLYGTITSRWYNPLAETGNGIPEPFRTGKAYKGNVTYLTPEMFQTHQLHNEEDVTCVTIQSYYYLDTDFVHNETFHYINSPPNDKLHLFKPGSDIQYGELLQAVRDATDGSSVLTASLTITIVLSIAALLV